MKICPVGDELFHSDGGTDRRTGMTKLIIAFRNFANVPKIPGNIHANQSTFYCYQRKKFALKTLYATLNVFVPLIVTCGSTIHIEHIVAFLLQKLYRERTTISRDAHCLVYCLFLSESS